MFLISILFLKRLQESFKKLNKFTTIMYNLSRQQCFQ